MTDEIITAQPEAEISAENEGAEMSVQSEAAIPSDEQEGGIEVKFNKQLRRLSESEARDFAEKGMKYDSLIPVLDRLKELSPDSSMSIAQLVDHLFKEREERASKEQNERNEGRQNRLTAQFIELKSKFPEVNIREIPKSVIEQSLKGEISLYYAYLGYLHGEKVKAERSSVAQEKASAAATGGLKDSPDRLSSPEIAAMLKGIWA
ncbi:MAG: hypothetical protein IIW73_03510 [Clostridia bacterium]|nr:hypothetical protein [Clostridia bacterium]